jgi:hypothetical protein
MSDKPDGQGLTVDIVLRPEWAAKESTDKQLWGMSGIAASATFTEALAYTVPAGKTFYITDVGFGCIGGVVAEVRGNLCIDDAVKTIFGGVQACSVQLSKPFVVDAGEEVEVKGLHISLDNINLAAHILGYEV